MGTTTSLLIQSEYYSSAFNSAIFDGSVRIYFAQHQEEQALKIHFQVQKLLQADRDDQSNGYRKSDRKTFVLLYPDRETYLKAFSDDGALPWRSTVLGEDRLVGLEAPLTFEKIERLAHLILAGIREDNSSATVAPFEGSVNASSLSEADLKG